MYPDLHEKILPQRGWRVVEEYHHQREIPKHLLEPRLKSLSESKQMPEAWTIQTLVFQRSCLTIENALTLTFIDHADKFEVQRLCDSFRYIEGVTLNPHDVCAGMKIEQQWKHVKNISLHSEKDVDGEDMYYFQLMCQTKDGQFEIRDCPQVFRIPGTRWKDDLARRLVEELKLKQTVVNGKDEFSV